MTSAGLTPGRRTGLVVVLAWLLAVAVGSGLTWYAVDRAGRAVLDPVSARALPTPAPSVPATPVPTPQVPATSTPAPSGPVDPSPSATPSTTAPEPAPRPASGTLPTAGGTLAVACDGTSAVLTYATPVTGWSAEVRDTGPQAVRVRFERGHDGGKVDVRAGCATGSPEFVLETEGED